jgi:hypothetical protein
MLEIVIVPCELTVKVAAVETRFPGFTTVTLTDPTEAVKLAGTDACNCPEFINIVCNAWLPQLTVDWVVYPVPFTVRLNAVPAFTADGLRVLIVGGAPVTVKVDALEVLPRGFWTVTLTDPTVLFRPLDTVAVNTFPLTNVVVSAFNPQYTVDEPT